MDYCLTFILQNKSTMRKLLLERLMVNVLSAQLILLFLYTALSKLKEHTEFQTGLTKLSLLGQTAITFLGLLSIIEIFIAVLLLLQRTKKNWLASYMLPMARFTLYISYILMSIPIFSCSYGGVLKKNRCSQLKINVLLQ